MTSVSQTSTARIDEDEEGPSLNQVCLDSDIKESNALLDDKDAVIKDLEEKLKQKSDECEYLSQQLKLEKFGIYRFSRDNTMIDFYTDFKHTILFWLLTDVLSPQLKTCRVHITKVAR